ncbi:Prolycopene isomerase, chloroplastic [Seminavis robusta]|uniref:Prolycopene isomerase, chloroplastic n=1 Tax=Seminavis robusta TaxID=568900 RepID=A0A9N8HTV1_9STRA|nr:Prolycopene isomerase, chloroplastic [Seminavis robusta]|eukprot:Sro1649_g288630.1 Prolycopene isomerase, chloroplastic (629) ;mRNA; f:20918-22884
MTRAFAVVFLPPAFLWSLTHGFASQFVGLLPAGTGSCSRDLTEHYFDPTGSRDSVLYSSAADDDTIGADELPPPNTDTSILEEVDVAIIGAGLGGLCAGAILNTLYGKKVGIYESHYLAGGCAHAFDRKSQKCGETFTFDSGPTILLGCSSPPFNPLAQVLQAVDQPIDWIPYDAWGMIENPGREELLKWRLQLGPDIFEQGPLQEFGGPTALEEFQALRESTKGLLAGVAIPAMAMRAGSTALIPLLRYFSTLLEIIQQGELTTSTFAPFMDGPIFQVKDQWLRNWLDALAFSLSGLPASRTSAAAMAFVIYDMHRPGASLDYPKGGFGEVVNALVRGVEQGSLGSKVHLRQHVETIDCSEDGSKITGITLRNGRRVEAKDGVICNVPVWSLRSLIKDDKILSKLNNMLPDLAPQKPRQTWDLTSGKPVVKSVRPSVDPQSQESLLANCDMAEMTGSFLHLHIAIDSKGLNLEEMEAHYTVMDRSLAGDGSPSDGPCGELNMIAVSNPCVIDKSLAPEGYMIIHAYGAGNEPYALWEGMKRNSDEYKQLKEQRAEVLWRAIESVIPDVRKRTVEQLIGSPITHERFLRRPRGTYGAATEDYLKDGSTPFPNLVLAGDSIFPGIGMPA